MVDENGPHYFVAFQTPGPKWVAGVKYNEQPEFMAHVGYMTELQDRGLTVLSGPFMEKAGGLNGVLADGGMTIFRAADLEEATQIGTDDPTVKSDMLNVEVKMLWVPFHE
jgi:uncharacterized protein YciI